MGLSSPILLSFLILVVSASTEVVPKKKVSIFSICFRSHLRPLLVIAKELTMRPNVDVTFTTNSGCEEYIRGFGLNMQIITIPTPVDQLTPPDDLAEIGVTQGKIEREMVKYYFDKWKNKENRPDIIINDFFMVAANDLAEIYDIKIVGFFNNVHLYQWVADSTFIPEYNSFPTIFDVYPASDSILYRVYRFLYNKWYYYHADKAMVGPRNELRESYGLPPVAQYNENRAERPYMAFIEGYFGFTEARLLPPFIQIVGPFMINESRKPLEQPVAQWLDTCDSFIYVSFGTMFQFTDQQAEVINALVKNSPFCFLIVSKVFKSNLKNVKVLPFVNQIDVLEHPKIKGFISHGGQGSVTETIMSLVPMVCLPQGRDQFYLCDRVQATGIGEMIKPYELTIERITSALNEITTNPRYKSVLKKQKIIMSNNEAEERVADLVLVFADIGYDHLITKWYSLPWYKKNELDIYVIYAVSIIILAKAIGYCCCKCKCKRKEKVD